MNTKEVANYLKVAESTVAKYAQKGKLSFTTEKRCKVYDLQDVIKLQQKIEEETDMPIFNEKGRKNLSKNGKKCKRGLNMLNNQMTKRHMETTTPRKLDTSKNYHKAGHMIRWKKSLANTQKSFFTWSAIM